MKEEENVVRYTKKSYSATDKNKIMTSEKK